MVPGKEWTVVDWSHEEIVIGNRVSILDKGFVELMDVMGDDQAVIEAARVSISGMEIRAVQSDEALIRYLMRHRHTSPFEMVEFKFKCKMPIFVARDWVRHRTASINEMSGRYSVLPSEWYVPAKADIQTQATKNKQGRSGDVMDDATAWQNEFRDEAAYNFRLYEKRIKNGMARELARVNLPVSTYTVWVWKMDLHNLLHFINLRASPKTQPELQAYANVIAEMVKERCPLSYQAFEDYVKNAVTLTAHDVEALRLYVADGTLVSSAAFPTKREHTEFMEKLERFVDAAR